MALCSLSHSSAFQRRLSRRPQSKWWVFCDRFICGGALMTITDSISEIFIKDLFDLLITGRCTWRIIRTISTGREGSPRRWWSRPTRARRATTAITVAITISTRTIHIIIRWRTRRHRRRSWTTIIIIITTTPAQSIPLVRPSICQLRFRSRSIRRTCHHLDSQLDSQQDFPIPR